jgi:hypothetical protein
LLDHEATLAPPRKPKLSNELFVAGFAAGRARNSGRQITIRTRIRALRHASEHTG